MNRRRTIQRDLVLQEIARRCDHPNAEQVFEAVSDTHPSISKATVYRNLNILEQEGLIRRVSLPGAQCDHYDRTLDNHYHVFCERCGKVADVDLAYMTQLSDAVHEASGYQLFRHEMVFHGLCPDCKNNDMQH